MACSPKYDWRELRGDGGMVALFPAKTQTLTRSVDLGGTKVNMTMQGARVDGVTFAAAWADLPAQADEAAAAGMRAKSIDAMRTGLLRNIDGKATRAGPVALQRTGRNAPPLAAESLVAAGLVQGKPVVLSARFAASGDRVYQLMVLGPEPVMNSDAGREATETFLVSARLD